MRQIFSILFIVFSAFIYSQNTVKMKIIVNPYLSLQNYEHFKRLTLNTSDSNIEFIDDFDFEWGYEYQLIVRQTKLKQSLSDGTKYVYCLDEVLSKVKVEDSTQFILFLDANRYYYQLSDEEMAINKTFSQLNDSVFLYFDNVEIVVPQSLKNDFVSIVDGSIRRFGNFVFENKNRIRLIGILP